MTLYAKSFWLGPHLLQEYDRIHDGHAASPLIGFVFLFLIILIPRLRALNNLFAMAQSVAPKMDLDPKYDHYDYPTTSPTVQSGHSGHTTPEQDAKVHQLRMSLEQMGYKDRLDTLTMVFTPGCANSLSLTGRSFVSSAQESSTLTMQSKCWLYPSTRQETD